MAARIPTVTDGVLRRADAPDLAPIALATPAWFAWLEDEAARSFSFRSATGSFTARKEWRRRGGAYWIAYRRRDGRLHKTYLGRSADLTLMRLIEVAATLGRPTGGDPAPVDTLSPASNATAAATRDEDRSPLVATRLQRPQVRPDAIARPRLVTRLDAARAARLVLVAAPAGAGKTTLVTSWLAAAGLPAAWVSLEPDDDDEARFWAAVIVALRAVRPGLGGAILGALRSPHPPAAAALLPALVDELAMQAGEAALVLDDCHVITAPAIHDGLARLVEALPPRWRLVIATRAEPPLPLARLRARGQLVELRAADLRFTEAEAATFLAGTMGLALTPCQAATLAAQTEGWAAGLQLAALALRERAGADGGADAVLAAFSGGHRYVLDYLADEVLAHQPPDLLAFLERTAILDRLCGPLCDAVTGGQDGQAMLERLERANLFTAPLDGERRWWRYHALFAGALRQRPARSAPREAPELHRRAARWHAAAGLTDAALGHALAAGDDALAADVVEGASRAPLLRGEAAAVRGWLGRLPEAVVRARPRLGLDLAQVLLMGGEYARLAAVLGDAKRALAAEEAAGAPARRALRAEADLLRAFWALQRGEADEALALAEGALATAPTDDAALRGALLLTVGSGRWLRGDAGAGAAFAAAAGLAEAVGAALTAALALASLAALHERAGALGAAEHAHERTLRLAGGDDATGEPPLPAAGFAHVGLAKVLRERDELAAADRRLAAGIALGRLGGTWGAIVDGAITQALVRQARGDAAGATASLDDAEAAVRERGDPAGTLARIATFRARLALARGELAAAARWARDCAPVREGDLDPRWEIEHLTLVRLRLAEGRPAEALPVLAALAAAAEAGGRTGSLIEILALEALARRAGGDERAALAALGRALALAEPEGYVRTFADEGAPMARLLARRRAATRRAGAPTAYLDRLLAALDAGHAEREAEAVSYQTEPRRAGAPALVEPLSPRELEVLGLVADGQANKEIARALIMAEATVKVHSKNAYGKLGVASRTEAVARARALGLLAG